MPNEVTFVVLVNETQVSEVVEELSKFAKVKHLPHRFELKDFR